MTQQLLTFTEDEVRAIIRETWWMKNFQESQTLIDSITDALRCIPAELRLQWQQLLKTDSEAACQMAIDHGWKPPHVFERTL